MGDCGSYFLGFLIAMFALIGNIKFNISLLPWLMVYSVFWFDATITLGIRFLSGEKWYQSHRSHAYQILHHQLGWTHQKVLIVSTLLNFVLLGFALFSLYSPVFAWPLFALNIILILSFLYLNIVRKKAMSALIAD